MPFANRRDLAVDQRPVAAQHCGWGLQTGFCSQISYWEFLKETFHSHQESVVVLGSSWGCCCHSLGPFHPEPTCPSGAKRMVPWPPLLPVRSIVEGQPSASATWQAWEGKAACLTRVWVGTSRAVAVAVAGGGEGRSPTHSSVWAERFSSHSCSASGEEGWWAWLPC